MGMREYIDLFTLTESAETDVAMNKQAREFLSHIIKHFMDANGAFDNWGLQLARFDGSGTFAMIESGDVGVETPYDNIRLLFGETSKPYSPTGSFGKFKSGKRYIRVNCMERVRSTDDIDKLVKAIVHNNKVHDIIMHEFIHVLDAYRNPAMFVDRGYNTVGVSRTEKQNVEYFNSPEEFNAYFHNISKKLLQFIHISRKNGNIDPGVSKIYGISRDFATTVANILKTNDVDYTAFLKRLSARNRRAMLTRLYKLHQEAIKYIPAT